MQGELEPEPQSNALSTMPLTLRVIARQQGGMVTDISVPFGFITKCMVSREEEVRVYSLLESSAPIPLEEGLNKPQCITDHEQDVELVRELGCLTDRTKLQGDTFRTSKPEGAPGYLGR